MKGSKFKVAVLVSCSSGWGRRLIRGIANYGLKIGNWQLLVEERGGDEPLHLPPGWHGDGIIARVSTKKLYEELVATGQPVINVSGIRLNGVDLPCVSTDYGANAQLAMQHFEERGFHHLAYCGLSNRPYEQRHCQAFVDVVKDRELNCHVFHPELPRHQRTWESERRELMSWLQSLPKPVGILAWGTRRGRDILNVCNEFHILVPEEVAVLAGDDDDLLCEVCYPPMSGIVTPAEQIGYQAAEMLDGLMNDQALETQIKLLAPKDVDTRVSTDTLAISDPSLSKAIRFIRDNIRQPIQVGDVAAAAQISRRALERRFTDAVGHSPAKEIHNARLKCAKKLLRESALSVADVAAASGYSSMEYMINRFQKDLGSTPLKYRTRFSGW